jgi:hypothetical protein
MTFKFALHFKLQLLKLRHSNFIKPVLVQVACMLEKLPCLAAHFYPLLFFVVNQVWSK